VIIFSNVVQVDVFLAPMLASLELDWEWGLLLRNCVIVSGLIKRMHCSAV
jgi:hypothetical protein